MAYSQATHSGFHYITLYHSCKRKFYFRHVLRLAPRLTPTPLINGTAFHLGKETFYRTSSEKKSLIAMADLLHAERGNMQYPDDYALIKTKLPLMLSSWIAHYGKRDLANYRFLALEEEFAVTFPNRMTATVRPDTVVEDRERCIFILETKTTGYSAAMTEISVNFGDQATTQIAAVRERFPKKHVYGVIPDILFWLKSSRTPRDIKCVRGQLVERSADDIEEWKLGTAYTLSEISQKVAALKTHSEFGLFPRNTDQCVSYNSPCPYMKICRERIDYARVVPHGFVREEASSKTTSAKKGRKK
jgi:hypothetical protein